MHRVKKLVQDPKVKQVLTQMKPKKSLWGFFGVVLFFIVPELIGFVWGEQITAYAQESLAHNVSLSIDMEMYYKALIMLFEDEGSWIGLFIGFVFLGWLFF